MPRGQRHLSQVKFSFKVKGHFPILPQLCAKNKAPLRCQVRYKILRHGAQCGPFREGGGHRRDPVVFSRKWTWSLRGGKVRGSVRLVGRFSSWREAWNSPRSKITGGGVEGEVHATRTTEVLTVGNSAQPPPTGTSDGSIDLGVGLKTTPSCPPLPPPSPRSPLLSGSLSLPPLAFLSRPRRTSSSTPFYPLFSRGNLAESGPIVPLLFYSAFSLSSVYSAATIVLLFVFFLPSPPPPPPPPRHPENFSYLCGPLPPSLCHGNATLIARRFSTVAPKRGVSDARWFLRRIRRSWLSWGSPLWVNWEIYTMWLFYSFRMVREGRWNRGRS